MNGLQETLLSLFSVISQAWELYQRVEEEEEEFETCLANVGATFEVDAETGELIHHITSARSQSEQRRRWGDTAALVDFFRLLAENVGIVEDVDHNEETGEYRNQHQNNHDHDDDGSRC